MLGLASGDRFHVSLLCRDVHAATTDLELEGGVVSIKFALSSDNPELVANCTPSEEQLRTYPLQTAISHTNPVKAKRGILFHEDDIDTGVSQGERSSPNGSGK